jgi:hypothetical protein
MVCNSFNRDILILLDKQEILWKCILDNGTEVWSDFDIPDQKDPWTRLKHYCDNNNYKVIEVRALCPGMPEQTIFQDPDGLDNFFIIRGISKELTDSSDIVYKFMSFGIMKDDGKIHVKKFYWPQFALGESEEIRELTPENESLLFKKRKKCEDGCTCQQKRRRLP